MKSKKSLAVRLTNISKHYIIHHEKPTLMERVINGKNEKFKALDNINLEIKKGEIVGIIGPNGSGKTTLLKIIAGITAPTKGTVKTSGRIVSLIDLEAGFHPDLTGYQNIFLNGMLLGMKRQEIKRKLNAIIKFADIKQFIDTPLFTYSGGMKLRLGFSVVAHVNPDTLLMDENFVVADQEFREKSFDKIQGFHDQGKTIIIASHYLDFLRGNCERIIWIDKGIVRKDGNPNRVIKEYMRHFKTTAD